MKKVGRFVALAALGGLGLPVLLSACATIMSGGGKQGVDFTSTPTGATVMVDNRNVGITPVEAELSRKDRHLVRIDMAGYQPFEMQLERKVNNWVWGNIIFGGIPGLAVDAITGALYKLSPDPVSANLVARNAQADKQGDRIVVRVVLMPDPKWEKIGQLDRVE